MMRLIIPLLLILAVGCSQTPYMQGRLAIDKGEYDTAVTQLYKELKIHPDSYEAWRELGIAFYKKGNLEQAEEALKRSNSIKPDAITNLYLGLVFEKTDRYDQALNAYAAAKNLRSSGRTRDMIESRLNAILDRKFKFEATEAIQNEAEIKTDTIPDNSIAVVTFDGSTMPNELQPLAMGLAEFTAADLAKINSLKVVDRIKINVILDELRISQNHYADTHIAPRMGRLMGSRKLIVGNLISTGTNEFQLDGALVSTADSTVTKTGSFDGKLNDFFKIEKDFVFAIIDTLGIKLTKEERDAVEEVPTESFLAFMAYSQGLFYQRRGMYDAAQRSFNNAARHDPSFNDASAMAARMVSAAALENGEGGGAVSAEAFEDKVVIEMEMELQEVSLDKIQTVNLINSGFIPNTGIYLRFGSSPIAPPGGGPIISGASIITIEGDFDNE